MEHLQDTQHSLSNGWHRKEKGEAVLLTKVYFAPKVAGVYQPSRIMANEGPHQNSTLARRRNCWEGERNKMELTDK